MNADAAGGDTPPPAEPSRPRARWRRLWRPAGWLLGCLALAAQQWTPHELAEEWYARRLYPPIIHALASANGIAPFSIAEALVPAAALLLSGVLAWVLWPRPGRTRRAAAALAGITAGLGWGLLAFSALWGVNYRRPPMAQRLGLRPGGTPEELVATARWLATEAARAAPPGDLKVPTPLPYSRAELDSRIEDAYARAGILLGVPAGRLGPAKAVRASGVLCRLGLSGIYSPFTGEPNYNRLQPEADLPFAIAHEKAHQRGIAPENEANFAAFVVLLASPDRALRYSAFLHAAGYTLGAVGRADPRAYRELTRLVAGRPMADWANTRAFWERYRGPAQRASQRVNDLYLRANRVPGGIRSYGAVVDLLVGYHRREKVSGGR